jgi:hypothetical protein
MKRVIWMGRQRRLPSKGGQNNSASVTGQRCTGMGLLALRLAQQDKRVRIVSVN